MNFDEIESFLENSQKRLAETQTVDFLYDLYIEITISKNELHKLIHFCLDDYQRKLYFSAIDLANSLQYITDKKINETIQLKAQNITYDFKIEKQYLQNDLEKHVQQTILFKEFSKKILSKKQFSKINNLSTHCHELNMSMKNYMEARMFNSKKWENEE